ncbi:MAG: F-box protein, partial [Parachlamydiales bacterium]|nr:F-box protein [Parachlamydiales bacterium]
MALPINRNSSRTYQTSIIDLPKDLLKEIFFKNLLPKEIVQLSFVCKTWKEISCDKGLWKKILREELLINKDMNLKDTDPLKAYQEHCNSKRNIFKNSWQSKELSRIVDSYYT